MNELDSDVISALRGLNLLAEAGIDWAHCSDIASVLRAQRIVDLHWRRIESILDRHRELVGRRKRSRRLQYCLLAAGKIALGVADSSTLLIDPSNAVSSIVAFHHVLGALRGRIQICDPYIDSSSVEHLDALCANADVQYLSFNVKNDGVARRTAAAFQTAGRRLEVRLSAKPDIHDRYMMDERQLLLLGASLNGIGRKQSFITRAGHDVHDVLRKDFKARWAQASVW